MQSFLVIACNIFAILEQCSIHILGPEPVVFISGPRWHIHRSKNVTAILREVCNKLVTFHTIRQGYRRSCRVLPNIPP